jgi:hypothetical protein
MFFLFPQQSAPRQQPPNQGSGSGSQGLLNYATLDLGSTDSVGDSLGDSARSPRNKSRHPSSADPERAEPLSYATIDFEKSESLREQAERARNAAMAKENIGGNKR